MIPSHEERIYVKQRQLRGSLLDQPGSIAHTSARDLASELLLYLDDSKACWMLATNRLRAILSVERVDGGFARPGDRHYHPGQSESLADGEEIPSLNGIAVSNTEAGMRRLWHSPKPVVFRSIREERAFGYQLRADLEQTGATTKMAFALLDETGPFALLCADRVKRGEPEWRSWQYELFEEMSKAVLSPILGAALSLSDDASQAGSDILGSLSKAECRVAELASMGMSYKEVARTLNRSVYTIDHQLRRIREKLGIETHAKLIRFLAVHQPSKQ